MKLFMRRGDQAGIEDNSLDIAKITKHTTDQKGKIHYYIVWKDTTEEPTWEPIANIDDIDVIRQYGK